MRELANIFRALADETRLKMMGLILRHGELCVCDFVQVLKITQSKASRHLRYLLHAGLLTDRRDGIWVHYRIADEFSQTERAAVLQVMDKLLPTADLDPLMHSLEEWLKQKEEQGTLSCMPLANSSKR
jgi:ArsR family transcriptional regulator